MTPLAKLASFAALLAVVFAAALLVGSSLGDGDSPRQRHDPTKHAR